MHCINREVPAVAKGTQVSEPTAYGFCNCSQVSPISLVTKQFNDETSINGTFSPRRTKYVSGALYGAAQTFFFGLFVLDIVTNDWRVSCLQQFPFGSRF